MAQNYLSGRVSRIGVGVPGFSTSGDLTLAVSGAVGVETTKPRAEVDTPNISIRGNIVDSSVAIGSIGYFLSQDEFGVRWRASDPAALSFITVYDNGSQVGLGEFGGLNFKTGVDEDYIKIVPNPVNPEIADINFDIRWVKFAYGQNKGISTGFGTDGTYASIPGFGTSEAVGVTSVGIGTIEPQDDFQVGIGSTGVTINGPEGKVEAELIKAKNIEVEGNLTVESLIVRPGISTLRFLEVEEFATIPVEYVGFSSIEEADITQLNADNILAGLTTLGVGGEDVFVLNDLYVQGGIGTFDGDVFVAGDLSVGGELFVEQLNAQNILITGVATVATGIFTSVNTEEVFATGVSTFNELQYNVGFGTTSNLENLFAIDAEIDNAVITDERITGVSTIATADIDNGFIKFGTIDDAILGVATVGLMTVTTDFSVGGATTLAGIVTTGTDAYVGEDLYVGGETFFNQINAINLDVSGVATFFQGIATNFTVTGLLSATDVTAGFATITEVNIGGGQIGGIDFPGTGDIEGNDLDFETGYIGILTGNYISYGIGSIGTFVSGIATITTLRGDQLFYTDESIINNVRFFDDRLEVAQNLSVVGAAITLGDVATDPRVGLTTIAGDAYVGNDLFVNGETFFKQINAVNLDVSGVATIFNQKITGVTSIASGFATDFFVELLDFDSATGSAATITNVSGDNLNFVGNSNFISGQTSKFLSVIRSPGGSEFEGTLQAVNILVSEDIGVDRDFIVAGISTLNIADIAQETVAISTITDLTVTGIATIAEVDVEDANVDNLYAGFTSTTELLVTGVTTFQGIVNIDDIVFTDLEVVGVSSVNQLFFNVGVGTELRVDDLTAGIATVGLASVSLLQATTINAFEAEIEELTADTAAVGVDSTSSALFVTGINTFIGFTTFTGDVFVDGDFTVTGIQSVGQLDAKQSQIGILTVFDRLDSQKITDLNQVSIAGSFIASGISTIGLSTFSADGDLNINRNLTVGGITTFEGVVKIEETSFVNQEVTGISSINQLFFNVGIGTTLTVNVATADTLTVNNDTELNELLVLGDSEFRGDDNTFLGSVGVGTTVTTQDLVVSNEADIASLKAGVATITTASIGFATITDQYVGVSTVEFIKAGIATLGITTVDTLTVTNDTQLNELLVLGDSEFRGSDNTFLGSVGVGTTVTTQDLVVSNEADIASLKAGFGTIASANIGFATIGAGTTTDSALFVTGLSTFSGVSSFFGNISVEGDLSVSGVTSFEQLDAAQSRIGILTVFEYLDNLGDLSVTGVTTLGLTTITDDLYVNNNITADNNIRAKGQLRADTDLLVIGTSQFDGAVAISSSLTVSDSISSTDLIVTGVTTLNVADVSDATIDIATVTDATISTSRIGFSSIGVLEVGFGSTTQGSFIRTGVGTIVGFTTITGDVFIDGKLSVVGLTTFNDLGAKTAQIGILTVSEYLSVLDIDQSPSGFSTLSNISFLDGVGENLGVTGLTTTADLTVTGFATFAQDIDVLGDTNLDGNLDVAGITSLGAPGPTGFTTIRGDLYIDGDLFVRDDIFKDEIVGRNAYFTGITTVNELFVNTGVATNFITTSFKAVTGIVTNLTAEFFYADEADIDRIFAGDLTVTGVSTLGASNPSGFTTALGDLYVGGEFYAANNAVVRGTLLADNVGVANQIKANVGIFTTGNIEDLFVTGQTTTKDLLVNGITTTPSLIAGEIQVGLLTVTASIEVGFATVTSLFVSGTSQLNTLIVDGTATFNDLTFFTEDSTFQEDVLINQNLAVNGIATISNLNVSDTITTPNMVSSGIATFNQIKVNVGEFENLRVQSGSLIVDNTLQANSGIITNLTFEVGLGNTLTLNNTLNVSGDTQLGLTTITRLDASEIEVANINVSGIATVSNIDILGGQVSVGIATVQELNFSDVVTNTAVRTITSSVSPTPILTLNSTTESAEFTITIRSGLEIHSTKIHVAIAGANKYWNEYSTVLSTTELATFDVIDSAGETVLQATPASAALTRFTVYSVSHNAP